MQRAYTASERGLSKRGEAHVEDVPLADLTLLPKSADRTFRKAHPLGPIYVNLRASEHKTPEFLALNPYGKVPILLDEGVVIYESTVVNEYLEDRFPEPPLIPTDPLGRAQVRLWEDCGDNAFLGPAEGIFIHDKGWRTFEPERLQQIQDVLARLEKHLEGKTFLVRDTFSLADICFAPRITILDQLGVPLPSSHINVGAWIERIGDRESTQGLET